MINRLITGMALLCLGHSVFAKQVSIATGATVAMNFYYEHLSQFTKTDYTSLSVVEHFLLGNHSSPELILYNINPDGWVIVSADDAVIPVLAYSFEGHYEPGNLPPAFTAWIKQYQDQIGFARQQKPSHAREVTLAWKHLASTDPSQLGPLSGHRAVLPLITSRWDQGSYYNEMCPVVQGGPGGHAWAGCVPACMGQIMYYYRWPATGTGSYSYGDPNFGILSADFGNTIYEWSGMPNSLNSSNHQVAELLYHLGVSCDLVYGAGGSGMYNHKAAYSLRTYFKYSPETRYVFRDSTSMNWDSILTAHLDRRMPLYYAGWSDPNISGHAFVCDGYQDSSYYHFNFGWSGTSDGYYYTSLLYPGGNNFTLAQEVIINCYPDTVNYIYPSFCNGETLLSFKTGSLEDGSSRMKNYLPNSVCSWLISPQTMEDSITNITLKFDLFDTNPEDLVTIFDGPTTESPLIGSYSGTSIPETIISTGNKMLITFASGAGQTAPGWLATYSTTSPVWCSGITIIVADTTEISDGSMGFNYRNNSNCRWKVSTPDGGPFTLYFRRFDSEPGKDFLRIFDLTTLDTLAEVSGSYAEETLPDSITVPGGKAYLIFSTNSSVTGKGWEIYYPASHVGFDEKTLPSNVTLFPNPTTEFVNISGKNLGPSSLHMELMNTAGRVLMKSVMPVENGIVQEKVSLSGFPKGLYFLKLISDTEVILKKIVTR
ncbi:MAG: C10 family peptidase [bacterium]